MAPGASLEIQKKHNKATLKMELQHCGNWLVEDGMCHLPLQTEAAVYVLIALKKSAMLPSESLSEKVIP